MFNQKDSIVDHIMELYHHFSVEECKELYEQYIGISSFVNGFMCGDYELMKDFLLKNGVEYESADDYNSSLIVNELMNSHQKLITNILFNETSFLINLISEDFNIDIPKRSVRNVFWYLSLDYKNRLKSNLPPKFNVEHEKYYTRIKVVDGVIKNKNIRYNVLSYKE